ncbi:cupin domain-containing protein [Flavobacterium sedimenticola]|uniref:Cupin domain-containing protein n=1 Tax=Flavobacterium sedimenticola TaxID=3043286 RepID=A0ABT6XNV8_9FLAO|nr:cupin domain-containing protein [Flavobacterium sedimenticola]MDI9256779.1 cupin domain-containing protein [Flavobacterium sedimenticola]
MNQTIKRWVLGHHVTSLNASGDYDIMVGETPAQVQGPPPHMHHSYHESFLMLEGEMEFIIDGVVKTAKSGDFITLPPNTLHTFRNASEKSCKWVNIHSPKGFAAFFETMGVAVDVPDAQEQSLSSDIIQKVISTAADYDMQLAI